MKKIYTILFLTAFGISPMVNAQTWAGFTNAGGDALWSNDTNWTVDGGGSLIDNLNIDIYEGPENATLDEDYTAKQFRIPGNKMESFTLTGNNKLTINIADGSQSNSDTGVKAIFNESANPTNLFLECDVTIANSEPSTGGNFNAVSVLSTVNGASSVNFAAGKTLELSGTASTSFWGPGAFHVNGNITGTQGILVGGSSGGGKLFLGGSTSDISNYTGTLTLANESELTLNSNGSSTINNLKVQLNGTTGKLTLESENVLNPTEIRVSTKAGQAFILNMFVNANQTLQGIKIKGDGSTLNLNIGSGVTSVAFGDNNANWHANSKINIIGYKEGVVKFGTDGTGLNGGAYLANITINGVVPSAGDPLSLDSNGNLVGASDLVLAIKDHTAFGFSMYPNPVKDRLNFNSQELLASVKAYDLLGKEVLSIQQPRNGIQVSALNRGLYILKIEAQNGSVISRKFIKK